MSKNPSIKDQDLVHLTIDGQSVTARKGQTVLEATQAAGIDIPVLCRHAALENWGACRMCLVKINKARGLQTACTFPVSDGLEIITEDAELFETRRFVLQLLFSERNHYCMFCQMSGNCELQDMAYRHGLDHWVYRRPFERMEVDASSRYLMMDPNRCILCTRCIRACSDTVANRTLGLRSRGIRTMVVADLDVPLGDSTCVECGVCAQVCPTGALVDTRSAYGGREQDVTHTATTCMQCSVGCTLDVVTRHQRLLRVDGVWDSEPNDGVLCVDGRFKPLYETRKRVTGPLVRRNGELEQADWNQALELVAGRIRLGRSQGLAACATTNEALQAFARLFDRAGRLEPMAPRLGVDRPARIADLLEADLIVVAGADPLNYQRVLGYLIRRTVDRGAVLILVGESENELAEKAMLSVRYDQIDLVSAEAANYGKVVIVHGVGLEPAAAAELEELPGQTLFLALDPARNGKGAEAAGLLPAPVTEADLLYVMLGEGTEPAGLVNGGFTVVQACYHSPLTAVADVVLPAPLWYERSGHITSLEGRTLPLTPVLPMPSGVRDEVDVLGALARLLER